MVGGDLIRGTLLIVIAIGGFAFDGNAMYGLHLMSVGLACQAQGNGRGGWERGMGEVFHALPLVNLAWDMALERIMLYISWRKKAVDSHTPSAGIL